MTPQNPLLDFSDAPLFDCIATPERDQAIACVAAQIQAHNIELVRVAWCDLHGNLRSKTLVARSAIQALHEGVGTVSTLLLKDTSDRTAFKVFEAGGMGDLPGFEGATDLLMLPDPTRFQRLPWAGIAQQRIPPPATRSPYAGDVPQAQQLPRSLAQADRVSERCERVRWESKKMQKPPEDRLPRRKEFARISQRIRRSD